MNKKIWIKKSIVVGLLFVICFSSGCQTLRKKFVRPKKKLSDFKKTIPILEPIVYPRNNKSSEQKYRHSYTLAQVWIKELENLIRRTRKTRYVKREIYLINQILEQFNTMQENLTEDKSDELRRIINDIESWRPPYKKGIVWRQYRYKLERRLRIINKEIRKRYQPNSVQYDFK